MAEDYCELCDLPLSTCVHGMPAPPPKPARSPARSSARSSAPRRAAAPPVVRTAAARPASRRTGQAAFRPHILAVLAEAGGRLDAEDVLLELEIRLDGQLRERDLEPGPNGEVRWHTAARAERKAMIDEGLVVPATPGVWELTERGRAAAR